MAETNRLVKAWRDRKTLGDDRKGEELAAFLPAALEIQATPPNPLARYLGRALMLLTGLAIVWACVSDIEVIASAEGKIIPSSRVKQIQPLQKGVVEALLVAEGDHVHQGQPLVELETTLTESDRNAIQADLDSVRLRLQVDEDFLAHLDTLSAEAGDVMGQISSDNDPGLSRKGIYRHLLEQQIAQYKAQVNSLKSTLDRTLAEQQISRETIIKLEETLPIATKTAKTLKGLYEKDFVAELEYLQAEQNRIQQRQDLATERQRLKLAESNEAEVRHQLEALLAQTKSTLLERIADQQRQQATLIEQLNKAVDLNSKQILYSPVDGRVQELSISTVGGVVTDAQQLMLIVPDEDQLEVEVFLQNKDIGFVEEGMPAEIKIHTFPFTKYGVINAEVTRTSSDAIVDDKLGLIYSMRLLMKQSSVSIDNRAIRLKPGMAVTADVKTGNRKIIEFILAPLIRKSSESLRER